MSDMFESIETTDYQHAAEGTWGEFATPTGRVAFLLTKARLGTSGTDLERRLIALLRPVREVIPASHLDFNQLLQRDLDDHRVSEKLVPYLLTPKMTGPAFFPPLMAVLLPFTEKRPAPAFPGESFEGESKDRGLTFYEKRYGQAYRTQHLWDTKAQKNHSIKLGRLGWNDEFAQLVVLDGQHRAMALLAIDRTINSRWDGAGNRYRHFYERKVKELLAGENFDLNKVEIPVTICWFPDLNGQEHDPHKAARKLFVDVNKEARQPSEARLTLLSDSELLNIFTRSLLNRLREPNPPLPLTTIEYDNPDRDSPRPIRWNALSNLNLLKIAVQRCVFGPSKVFDDMGFWPTGRPSTSKLDGHMRDRLDVTSLFSDTIEDGERILLRSQLGNEKFPVKYVSKLVDRFRSSWGEAILDILGGICFYKAHTKAAEYMESTWLEDDAFSSLAKDALFGGVGMFWTLRSSNDSWIELKDRIKEEKGTIPIAPDIIRAWEVLQKKVTEFEVQRSKEYLGKKGDSDENVEKTKRFFENVNTHACQLGAVLAVATLANACGKNHKDIAEFARAIVSAWNTALESNRTKEETRKLIFGRDEIIAHPLNRIKKLDTPYALSFRYFWLELLSIPIAKEKIKAVVSEATLDEWTAKAREVYLSDLVNEKIKAIKETKSDIDDTTAKKEAQQATKKEVSYAYCHWFEMKKEIADKTVDGSLFVIKTGFFKAKEDDIQEQSVEIHKEQNPEGILQVLNEFPED